MRKAVILAAGKGSRLYPITHHIAKPLLPIANKTTLLYSFERLKEIEIHDICIVVGENEPQMRHALGDGSQFGVQLSFVRQSEPKGLAHAVGFARDFVAGERFALYLGDAIYSHDFKPFARAFREGDAENMNIVAEVDDPRSYGVANLDGDRIVKLVEKPPVPESNWAMAGLYFFGPELWNVLPDLAPSGRGEYEITDAIQLLVDRGHKVVAGKYAGRWFDTGTLSSYLDTSRFLTDGKPLVSTDAEVSAKVGSFAVVGDGAKVNVRSIENTVILPGSEVSGDVDLTGCVIGGKAFLTQDASDTILWDGRGKV